MKKNKTSFTSGLSTRAVGYAANVQVIAERAPALAENFVGRPRGTDVFPALAVHFR